MFADGASFASVPDGAMAPNTSMALPSVSAGGAMPGGLSDAELQASLLQVKLYRMFRGETAATPAEVLAEFGPVGAVPWAAVVAVMQDAEKAQWAGRFAPDHCPSAEEFTQFAAESKLPK